MLKPPPHLRLIGLSDSQLPFRVPYEDDTTVPEGYEVVAIIIGTGNPSVLA